LGDEKEQKQSRSGMSALGKLRTNAAAFGSAHMRIRVESYSGYKADQRPLRFHLGDRCLEVREVSDQWYNPAADYFRVQAQDGQTYVLKRDWSGSEDVWTLEAYRRESNSGS